MLVATDDGCRLHVATEGPPSAPPLILLNSLGTDIGMWDAQRRAFTERHKLWLYDKRGHGRSDVPDGDYTIDQLGRDVIALMDHAGIAKSDLCGISIGGLTALWLATHAPERVSRVVLSNTAARIGSVEMWNQRIALIRDEGMAALADATMGRWFTPRYHECQPQTVARIRTIFMTVDVNGYAGCCAALREADLRSVAGRMQAPALVMSGAHDVATPPADGRWLANMIPGARFVELDAAHLSNIERADEFNEQVLTFLEE